jgi:hypothetical protein
MSWDKNTIVRSSIDMVVSTLDNLSVPYSLETLGFVRGDGMNDDFFDDVTKEITSKKYPIRKLSYQDVVIQEVMARSHDCDGDDFLDSKEFSKGNYEPLPLEYYYDNK